MAKPTARALARRGGGGYIALMSRTRTAGTPFVKMHGHGNDFVIVDARGRTDPVTPALARALGDRHRGVGFDQLVTLRDSARPEIAAEIAFWNADGSLSGACGNGARCAADLLMRDLGLEALTLRSATALLACARLPNGMIRVDMGAPRLDWREIPLAAPDDTLRLDFTPDPVEAPELAAPGAVNMGNPHVVFFVADAEAAPVARLGPLIEHDPRFPERSNVEFVQVIDRTRLRARVWERGVGVTLACGSGACAVVVAAARRGLCERRAVVVMDGGPLAVDWAEADGHVHLIGPTRRVCDGVLAPEFLASAEAEDVRA